MPFLPSFLICSFTSSAFSFSHDGTVRRYGRADWDIPLLYRAKYGTRNTPIRHQHQHNRSSAQQCTAAAIVHMCPNSGFRAFARELRGAFRPIATGELGHMFRALAQVVFQRQTLENSKLLPRSVHTTHVE